MPLTEWYVVCRQCNIPVSWLLLQEEGLIISKTRGDDSMGISGLNGWLSKWKKGTASVK